MANKQAAPTKRRFRAYVNLPTQEISRLLVPAVLIGAGSGLGAVVFRKLISFFTWFFFTGFPSWTHGLYPFNMVAIPVIGALLFGPMIWKWAREARGHGVPEVMEAVALKGGRIRPIVAVVKSLASAINIGSGGAIGREGPIAQIGSALGSTLGQALHLPPRYMRLVVAAGAAGGISATFNAPIAGAIFGMEVILRDFSPEAFAAIGISSVLADIVAIPFLGSAVYFPLPAGVTLHSPWELLLFALLGIIAAFAGTSFTTFLYWLEDRFNAWKLHEAVKPAAGAILLGVLITVLPQVRGLGYGVMATAFQQHMGLGILILLLLGKFLAASLTLGSGGSGGIFTPTLFMGTMLGEVFGLVSHQLFPAAVGPAASYALVGAAAVFASAARAPITAILIVMEMSQNYVLVLPLILATLVATRVSGIMLRDSIYTLKLVRRGVKLFGETPVDILQQLTARDAMITEMPVISPDTTVQKAAALLAGKFRYALPVVGEGRLQGIVTVSDLERIQEQNMRSKAEASQKFTAHDAMVTEVVVAYPDEHLRDVLRRMSRADVGQLLVVDHDNPEKLLGMIRRVDIVKAMEGKLGPSDKTEDMPSPLEPDLPSVPEGAYVRFNLLPSSPFVRRPLRDVGVPAGLVVVMVCRGRHCLVPHGNTVLMPDDEILLYVVPKSTSDQARTFFQTGNGGQPAASN